MCIYIYIYVCVYIYIYMCVYIYIYIYMNRLTLRERERDFLNILKYFASFFKFGLQARNCLQMFKNVKVSKNRNFADKFFIKSMIKEE